MQNDRESGINCFTEVEAMSELVQVVKIEKRIFTICGVQVMLDRDLAELYDPRTQASGAKFAANFI